ncbi:hypothetical protein [Streptomyces sp. NPDC048192]|uniref:hypothetical protein n=1 Tax=Streptomyces sp. NPDC048192 TaxID=3365510 RepID=UPI0037209F01
MVTLPAAADTDLRADDPIARCLRHEEQLLRARWSERARCGPPSMPGTATETATATGSEPIAVE